MKEALTTEVIPYLRSLGFKGSLPDLYRPRDDSFECLQFYFKRDREDNRFFVQAGRVSSLGLKWHHPLPHIVTPAKVRVTQLQRVIRLGAKAPSNDHWFDFSREPVGAVAEEVLSHLAASDYWVRLAEVPVTINGKGYHR